MKKKVFAFVMAAVMVFALMGCTFTKTVTRTETVTDANGNTTTTSTVTSTQNGKQTETTTVEQSTEAAAEDDAIVATLAFDNQTGVSIYTMKFSGAQSDDWGEDILGEFAPLEDGETIAFHDKFVYHADNVLWDLKIADENDNAIEFRGMDLSVAADPQNISIVLTYDAESDGFIATVQ